MALLLHRAPQMDSVIPFQSSIAAPSDQSLIESSYAIATATDKSNGAVNTATNAGLVLATDPPVVTKISVSVQTQSATATPTPSAAPTHSHGLSPGIIAAIVVPIFAVLLIPLIYFLYRGHKMKQDAQRRNSQRSSQEAMIMREKVEPKKDHGPPPPRPRRTPGDGPKDPPRPTNSLGLFNFDLNAGENPPAEPPKQTPQGLSVARTLQMRRSQASVVKTERTSQQRMSDLRNGLRNNPPTNRNSKNTDFADAPPPYHQPSVSHFAPLNRIGTAVTQPGRPKLSRNPSSNTIPRQPSPPPTQEMPRPRTATSPRQRPEARDPAPRPRTATAPTSVYSNYHDSLQGSLQPPNAQGRVATGAISPLPRAISPINNYQLPTFGLGSDRGFSLDIDERRVSPERQTSTERRVSPDRRSDVSGLSFDPNWVSDGNRTHRQSERPVSPVESNESLGLRTRDYL